MAAMPDFRLFPAVPGHQAEWAPVFLEPMHGSGERFVAAVVACDEVGSFHVELTLRSRTLKCMYGDQSDVVLGIAELVQEALQDHLAMGGKLADWVSPIHACSLGPIRKAVGVDLPAIANRGASLTASLYGKGIDEFPAVPEDLSAFAPDVDRWLQQIRTSVNSRAPGLDARFNQEVRIKPGASATRIGYLGDRIAANFDLLVPGPNLSNKRWRSKARLVDLQILRDQVDLFGRRTSYELMLWVPEKNSPAYSEKQLDTAHEAFAELEAFGDKHELIVQRLGTAESAADRILALEQPA